MVEGCWHKCNAGWASSPLKDQIDENPKLRSPLSLPEHIMVGVYRKTQQLVAIKCIAKESLKKKAEVDAVRQEIRIHSQLHHPCIAPLLFGEETPGSFLIVTLLANAGDLHEKTKYNAIRELDARNFAEQMLEALSYLHDMGIMHGDIKPHNMLLFEEHGKHRVQLCDFGLAQEVANNAGGCVKFTQLEGTAGYFSPEEIHGDDYGCASDLFVLGVILFELIGGYAPFYPAQHFVEDVEFDSEAWQHASQDSQVVITSLLRLEPARRPSARQVLLATWFGMDIAETSEGCAIPPASLPFWRFCELHGESL
mmetsp:Transcript_95706/g.255790  ORF Transcript_95706/g.255790 Transcript_95706/m.255790 type:complete len:310 (-) Transcript_95706:57-986(-)